MSNPFAYKRIVVGTALRHSGHPAVLRAVNLAQRTDGSVTVVHAVEEGGGRAADGAARLPASLAEAQSVLTRLQGTHPRLEAIRVIADRSWIGLPEVAREVGAQLVVIGSHVHSQLTALLGATSDRILSRAPGDVLVVRSEAYNAADPPRDFRRILLATDLSAHGETAARRAAALAESYGAELVLLHVLDHYPTDRENDDIAREDEDPLEHQREVKTGKLRDLAERIGSPQAAIKVVSTTDSARHAVPDFAREVGADLVVTGSPAHTPFAALLGSTAQAIVHHAPCDVLFVRNGGGL